jgi:tyrosinase
MSDVASSPGDPIFFMHHGFVDRNWRTWQTTDPTDRLYQVGGYTTTSDPKTPLTLDYILTSKGLRPDVTVRDVMDTMGGYLCYQYDS